MRTHYCGDLTKTQVDERVVVCGWVHRRRDLGGVIFINVRDRSGVVQVIINPEKKAVFSIAEKLKNEFIVKITGLVRARPDSMANATMKTGAIEIDADEIEILCESETPPFPIDNYVPVNEELRLKYRYLDLRRPEMAANLVLSARLAKAIRQYLDDQHFLEIETPILTKATPEGARDYLVPSRVHHGHFYALPQSPQLFKQILMMAGMDRYYQIVKCFRDEDLRADRQPEFTQLDLELSFVTERDIQDVIEGMMRFIFKAVIDVELPVFERMTYAESMKRFGSDKPDLRNPLELVDIADLLRDSSFTVFSTVAQNPSGRIAALRVPNGCQLSRKQLDEYTQFVGIYGAKGLAYLKVNELSQGMAGLQSSLLKFLSPETVAAILNRAQAKTGDILFICADKIKVVNESLGALRLKVGDDLSLTQAGWRPLWVTEFPMFEEIDGQWTSAHHPFTAPAISDIDHMKNNPAQCLSRAWDMVLNGNELGSGSMRIYDVKLQMAVFELLGIGAAEAQEKFGFLLEAMRYGCPPIGGMGIGFGRIVMLMAGAKSLREVMAFPKTTTASCPLTDAPSVISDAQLKELGLRVED
ncbi:MAG: aspartate--tRNA ligase [Gammaproteobacteria bacterium GWE2_42_36]|nr:MAG: aspartate--tRNA ligase [Gammaproteobacteria bacterium GWE2_42_36]HCU05120.1 aspartate--tRNA ligase [Coxiellaceae bacterium]